VIGAGYKQAVVTLAERKSGFAVLSHVTRNTSELVSKAIITTTRAPLTQRVKTVTYGDGKSLRIMLLWMRR
jgi:IS30 family transposase